MEESIKRVKRLRQKEEEFLRIPNWSELYPELLRDVFNRLSLISLNRAKLVCSSWYSASKDCVPIQNQIPWLFFKDYDSSSCMLYVPEDKEKVYRSRDFGVDVARSFCLTTCGSWLLLLNARCNLYILNINLYILNILTGERIDLPHSQSFIRSHNEVACLWIDNKTKDYLVIMAESRTFIKKGYNNWQILRDYHHNNSYCKDAIYNDKNQELYVHDRPYFDPDKIHIWDFSGGKPCKVRSVSLPYFNIKHLMNDSFGNKFRALLDSRMAVTLSGDFLMVSRILRVDKSWYFCILMLNEVGGKWVKIDSLGDEALIYQMGITVIANDNIPGIKRNSIYFSNKSGVVSVYDLTTQQEEPFPQCVQSSMSFFTGQWLLARWFFPC